MTHAEKREKAIQEIVEWAIARDPWWGGEGQRDRRTTALRQMTDDELRAEYRWAKKYNGPRGVEA